MKKVNLYCLAFVLGFASLLSCSEKEEPILYPVGDDESRQVLNAFLGGSPQEKPDAYHDASPINFISTNSPKFLLLHGREDMLVPISQAEKFQLALLGKNVEVETVYYSGGHGIPPERIDQAFEAIKAFIE
ncbi:alpha/beta hydrolase family protein [Belliella marina]|uniref:Alpha/beta hydrolase family protein n=1 Tax=Belliella marina TaxID=1644146 RepID=A0ABW4VMB2_9BACT